MIGQSKYPPLNLRICSKNSRHVFGSSIPNAIDLVTSIADKNGWPVTATEDSSVFTTPGALDNCTTMAFLHTTGDFLVEAEFDGLYEFLVNGGSWLGIHSGPLFLFFCGLFFTETSIPLLT